ncbi:hypothetical protein Ahy_B05g073978 isoform B [Arachis hypogaea]|uniref:Uncharacterized protein n=1 Tax=Arachis hypogaea TaxID=3818 RepID=A0A444YXL8_ARAHY|nr:hypothetical protein Ahy_B05g073978 isoform B [Arachis hypogaea]
MLRRNRTVFTLSPSPRCCFLGALIQRAKKHQPPPSSPSHTHGAIANGKFVCNLKFSVGNIKIKFWNHVLLSVSVPTSALYTHPSKFSIGVAISLAPPSHRTSITLNFHCTEALSHPFPVLLRRTPSVGLARVAPLRTLMCVSLFDLTTSTCSSPCVAAFLSSILPQLCRTENQDAIDAVIVGMLADPKEARARIREVHFFPFNPGDKRTALTYIESDGNWHISSKDIEPLQLQRGCEEKGYATIVKFAERGLRSLGVARQEVPEKSKDAPGALWQFLALLPLFDPPRHDSAETITRTLNLGDQLAIAKETGRRLGMGTNISAYCSRSRAWLSIKSYQPPLPSDQVKSLNEYDEEGEASRRVRGRGRGGRGRGRGREDSLYSLFWFLREYEKYLLGHNLFHIGNYDGGMKYSNGWDGGRGRGREMFHFYWIKDSRHRCTASFTHCQMTCPYKIKTHLVGKSGVTPNVATSLQYCYACHVFDKFPERDGKERNLFSVFPFPNSQDLGTFPLGLLMKLVNLLCWLCNWECDKDTVREGEHVFGVAHIFASFNDTFIAASQVHGGQLTAGFVDGSVRLYDIRTPEIVEKVVGIGFQPGLDPRKFGCLSCVCNIPKLGEEGQAEKGAKEGGSKVLGQVLLQTSHIIP